MALMAGGSEQAALMAGGSEQAVEFLVDFAGSYLNTHMAFEIM